jgi:RNA polymerase sigma-70 factor, ECF subfamily
MAAPHPPRQPGFVDWVSELARAHTRALSGIARAEGLTADDALDAVQEAFQTFLDLPEARALVGHEQDSRRLLSAVVRNAARNMRRRAFRRLPHDNLTGGSEIADDVPGVDELLARAEDELRLMGCVSKLSDVQQRVVRLRMLQELSGDDVARELGLRPDHVATLLYRAKKELFRCVTKSAPERDADKPPEPTGAPPMRPNSPGQG